MSDLVRNGLAFYWGTRVSLEGYQWLRPGYEGDQAKSRMVKVELLSVVAKDLGCSMAQLGGAGCARNPRVSTVILGASRVEQLTENLGALELVPRLDTAVMERIEGILDNKPPAERDWR
jgi:aryl-alcohol dehydrogenase-like predicted oxidoreductase